MSAGRQIHRFLRAAHRLARGVAACLFLLGAAFAEAPAEYYATAEGLGGEPLKAELHLIIRGHTVLPYAGIIEPLRVLWEDSADASKIRPIYGGAPVPKTDLSWNREHLWPRSRGVNPSSQPDGGPDDSDLFHVVPADANVNSSRSNRYFDFSSPADGSFADPAHVEAPLCSRDFNSWQPPPEERGDIARAMFYMAVRYEGTEPGTTDLELVTLAPTDAQMANLATLLAWHAADPPDDAERARNDRIFTTYQHNRNPFIDRPEWVAAIWGTLTGATTVQVTNHSRGAIESIGLSSVFTFTLNTPAPAEGFTIRYAIAGTATASDYHLAGAGLDGTAQSLTFPAGARSGAITLTPVDDGSAEPLETVEITILPEPPYDVIGGPARTTIADVPTAPRGTLAAWDFNTTPFPSPILATDGIGVLDTSGWGGLVKNFNGVTGQSLALERDAAGNGTHIEFAFSTLGWTNLRLTFFTRANATGSFTSGTWSWSTDGETYTSIEGISTHATDTVFQLRTLDLSAIPALQNTANVRLRYRLNGATQSLANNRLDDIAITGYRYSPAWLTRFPALTGALAEPTADPDGDTFINLTEWALDRDPFAGAVQPAAIVGSVIAPDPADGDVPKTWPAVTFTRRTDSKRVIVLPEESLDLRTWTSGCVLIETAPGPRPETEIVTYRATTPAGAAAVFFRLRVFEF